MKVTTFHMQAFGSYWTPLGGAFLCAILMQPTRLTFNIDEHFANMISSFCATQNRLSPSTLKCLDCLEPGLEDCTGGFTLCENSQLSCLARWDCKCSHQNSELIIFRRPKRREERRPRRRTPPSAPPFARESTCLGLRISSLLSTIPSW